MRRLFLLAALSAAVIGATPVQAQQSPNTLLNVSYDIARELYAAVNVDFIKAWKQKTGQDLTINQSHAGSSRQARAILEGLEADVVTFNQVTDVQVLHDKGNFVAADWQKRLPNNASPYYSLPAFLVRKGNPKNIKDWDDLVRPDVKVVFPNPKTSGNARYTYLAARAYAKAKYGSEEKADEFIVKLFKNVPVFDTGGRGATTTFLERDIGDVLVTFEAETNAIRDQAPDKAQTVVPSMSLLAEFPVAIVDKVVDKRGSRPLATAYLDYLYSRDGQEILAKFYNRVHNPEIVAKYKDKFPELKLVTVEDEFGGWDRVTKEHLAPGAKLDQLFGSVKGL